MDFNQAITRATHAARAEIKSVQNGALKAVNPAL